MVNGPARGDVVRTCIGCRSRAAKGELLRLVLGVDEGAPGVVPDPRATAPGRGAYLHPVPECLELADRRRAFARALRYPPGSRGGLATAALRRFLADHTDR